MEGIDLLNKLGAVVTLFLVKSRTYMLIFFNKSSLILLLEFNEDYKKTRSRFYCCYCDYKFATFMQCEAITTF